MFNPSCFSAVAKLSQSLRQVPKRVYHIVAVESIGQFLDNRGRWWTRRGKKAEDASRTHRRREELGHLFRRIAGREATCTRSSDTARVITTATSRERGLEMKRDEEKVQYRLHDTTRATWRALS